MLILIRAIMLIMPKMLTMVLSGENTMLVQVGGHGLTRVSRNADLPKPHTREEEKRRAPGFSFARHTIHWKEGEKEMRGE